MDFFSFLPIIIFIYAIATMFNPKNKAPKNRRQNPSPPQGTWKERMEELERQWFPQEVAQKPQPQPIEPTIRQSSEGFGTEGISGSEGSFNTEGVWGTEGTYGSEGSFGSEGTIEAEKSRGLLEPSPKEVRTGKPKHQENPVKFPKITEDSLRQGVIWAEVLGKPRARGGWSYNRRH